MTRVTLALFACDDPLAMRETDRGRIGPSPMFHLSFPGCAADKSSPPARAMDVTWLDSRADASPSGFPTKGFHTGVCA